MALKTCVVSQSPAHNARPTKWSPAIREERRGVGQTGQKTNLQHITKIYLLQSYIAVNFPRTPGVPHRKSIGHVIFLLVLRNDHRRRSLGRAMPL